MTTLLNWVAACDPMPPLTGVCFLVLASARAMCRAGLGRGSDGLPFAALRVPCDARFPGPVAELAAFASLSALKHLQRVRSRSARRARPGTLRFSAAPIRPAQAPPAALPASTSVFDVAYATTVSATGHPGGDQRASEALRSTGLGARARSAPRELTRRVCSSAVSAANVASYAAGPQDRAPQGSRSVAKTASAKRWALPGCPVAAQGPAILKFDDRIGPSVQIRSMHCGSRRARWSD